jgi:hypothetical protein
VEVGFENCSNLAREREEVVLRGVSGWLEPSEAWLARRNGISSAFRSRHMGNVNSILQPPEHTEARQGRKILKATFGGILTDRPHTVGVCQSCVTIHALRALVEIGQAVDDR